MRHRLAWLVLFSAAILITAIFYTEKVWATAANGFVPTTLAKGALDGFEVFNHSIQPNGDIWLSLQKTKGPSDLFVQSNVWQPVNPITHVVATTGWHSHPGHSLIIVTAGAVTNYESNDPECTPHVYTQGMSFVDSGGDHVHVIRNEGNVIASTIAVQLIPAGQLRRIDAPAPANCPGIE
jgi:hypothetical protein